MIGFEFHMLMYILLITALFHQIYTCQYVSQELRKNLNPFFPATCGEGLDPKKKTCHLVKGRGANGPESEKFAMKRGEGPSPQSGERTARWRPCALRLDSCMGRP